MVTITLKGREIPLCYTTMELLTFQKEIGPIEKTVAMITGRNPEDETDTSPYMGAEHLGAVGKAARILGNAGLEEAGEKPDLTEKWILRAMKPTEVHVVIESIMDAMREGMKSEIPQEPQVGPIDVTLEEMKKKD